MDIESGSPRLCLVVSLVGLGPLYYYSASFSTDGSASDPKAQWRHNDHHIPLWNWPSFSKEALQEARHEGISSYQSTHGRWLIWQSVSFGVRNLLLFGLCPVVFLTSLDNLRNYSQRCVKNLPRSFNNMAAMRQWRGFEFQLKYLLGCCLSVFFKIKTNKRTKF